MKIVNVGDARQGLETTEGLVWIRKGQQIDVELTESGLRGAKRISSLLIEGHVRDEAARRVENASEAGSESANHIYELETQVSQLKAKIANISDELTTSAAKIEELETVVADRDEQIKSLQTQVDELTPKDESEKTPEDIVGLESKHKGAGKYSVWNGDVELVSGMTSEQSTNFNAMDDAAKNAWVREQTASAD